MSATTATLLLRLAIGLCLVSAQPPTPVPPPTPLPAGMCSAYWSTVGSGNKYPGMLGLALNKASAVLSDPTQPPLGWVYGPAFPVPMSLPGYSVIHLGATLAVSQLWAPTDASYYYVATATAYASGSGNLWLIYPCPGTPAPPTPLPPAMCSATWSSVGPAHKYPDQLRLALQKGVAVLSDPTQPPLGWNSPASLNPNLAGYSILHLGSTLQLALQWCCSPTDATFYDIKTTTQYATGTGGLVLTYPCPGTPAPPPTPLPATPAP